LFADPAVVTYNAVAKSLVRTGTEAEKSTYGLNDSGVIYKMELGHSSKSRNRAYAKYQRTAAVTDPLIPAQNIAIGGTATFSVDFPSQMSAADVVLMAKALRDFLTDAFLLKLANFET